MNQELIDLVRELAKTAASQQTMQIGNIRSGRRPMSVDTLLRKEKDGTLYKATEVIKKAATEAKVPLPGTLGMKRIPRDPRDPLPSPPVDDASNEPDSGLDFRYQDSGSMSSELAKSGQVSFEEATEALKRLRELEEEKPTAEDIGRAGITGAMAGTLSTVGGGLIRGDVQKSMREGYGALPRAGVVNKLKGVLAGSGKVGRGLAGAAVGSSIFGASLPLLRQAVERRSEEQRLKEYLGIRPGTTLRGKIRRATGL